MAAEVITHVLLNWKTFCDYPNISAVEPPLRQAAGTIYDTPETALPPGIEIPTPPVVRDSTEMFDFTAADLKL